MLKKHKLLIDKDCPMCRLYGKSFVHFRMAAEDCILVYQSEEASSYKEIDQERAKNEIALIDLSTGKTTYGIDSLINIITQRIPSLKNFLQHPIIHTPLTILYRFISSNSKVISPAPSDTNNRACNPDFNLHYRWAYIIFVALATALIVNNFTAQLFPHFGWPHNLATELAICFGQVTWQGIAALLIIRKNRLTYLGNMSTVSMMGALLLIPATLLLTLFTFSIYFKLVLFFSVIGFMFFEHIRRCHLLGVSSWMTISWVIYRVTALSLLIFLIHHNLV